MSLSLSAIFCCVDKTPKTKPIAAETIMVIAMISSLLGFIILNSFVSKVEFYPSSGLNITSVYRINSHCLNEIYE